MARSHKELIVWQKSMDFVDFIYEITEVFPPREQYRLTSQLIRAAISVPANIAEGNARGTRRDYAHFISVSRGSLLEADTYIHIALRRGYITEESAAPVLNLVAEIDRMLTALRARLLA